MHITAWAMSLGFDKMRYFQRRAEAAVYGRGNQRAVKVYFDFRDSSSLRASLPLNYGT